MHHVIEALKADLKFEYECRRDAKDALDNPRRKMTDSTRDAFKESLRLADERIPQFEKAIEILVTDDVRERAL